VERSGSSVNDHRNSAVVIIGIPQVERAVAA
jgi:hypothetical protein